MKGKKGPNKGKLNRWWGVGGGNHPVLVGFGGREGRVNMASYIILLDVLIYGRAHLALSQRAIALALAVSNAQRRDPRTMLKAADKRGQTQRTTEA